MFHLESLEMGVGLTTIFQNNSCFYPIFVVLRLQKQRKVFKDECTILNF